MVALCYDCSRDAAAAGAQGVSIGNAAAKCNSEGADAGPALCYFMRRLPRLTVLTLLSVLTCFRPRSAAAQGVLTPADSAILAAQPLKRLVLDASLYRRLSFLAAGLDREVVLCLQGSVSGDTAVVREFVMPDLVSSSADHVEPTPCARGTLAVWHNHPWTGPDSSFGLKVPEDLCSLSQPDLRTVTADSIPFAVVSVGRTHASILCWWRRAQAVINRHVKYLPRFPRQWVEQPTIAGVVDSLTPPVGR
jgi:hypothetical protein